MSDIKLDGDAAVVGGIHTDSHNVENNYNTTNTTTTHNTVNNQTVYQAQKTNAELQQDNETQFMQAIMERCSDGQLTTQEVAELNLMAQQYRIPAMRVNQLIEQVRRSMVTMQGGKGVEFLAGQAIQEIYSAVTACQVDVLHRKLNTLQQIASTTPDPQVQFYFHLLQASLTPETAAIAFLNSHADNYWQLYWVHVAYIKLGQIDNASAMLTRLGGFSSPEGDIALLMALDNLADYRKNPQQDYFIIQAQQYLEQANQLGLSEPLSPLWYAAKEAMLEEQHPEEWYRFYVEYTLKELCPAQAPVMPQMPPEMPKMPKMQMPPMPKFNAQSVNLAQMQGFNPLQAAQQMGLGSAGTIKQMTTPFGQPAQPNVPPMPGAAPSMPNTVPPMPGSVPSASPSAPPVPMPGASASHPQPAKSAPAYEQMVSEVRQAEDSIHEEDPLEDHYGILLTNSMKLAGKYGCTQQEVYDVFNDFIQTAYDQQMFWSFLDAAQSQLASDEAPSWMDYNNLISEFIEEQGLPTGPDLHLFIIGGDDVVPIPLVEDPYEHGSEPIPSDMCYAYPDTFIIDLIDGGICDLNIDGVRNNVARLPLENGRMQTDIQSDLAAYFNISGLYSGGIPVGSVVMSSNSEWIPASVTMSEHLPLVFSGEDPELVRNGMYISPKLMTNDEEALNVYRKSLSQSDMLMFNLHGADAHDMPGFYSKGEAFHPSLLSDSTARVFNTVACYGARYRDYERSQSMVLSALYGGGVLLYTGSLVPVPMFYNSETNEARELLLNPGTGSEVFMRLYALYQFKGLTAGRALLQAKFDYFNMCRHVESDAFSFSTILMFSLYGNPMLHVRRRAHVLASALANDAMPPAPVKGDTTPIRKARVQRVMSKSGPGVGQQSLVEQVRGAVDANLNAIRSMVEQHLYNALGLPPRLLDSIDVIDRQDGETYYSFNYHDPEAVYSADTFAEVDKTGALKRIYTTK